MLGASATCQDVELNVQNERLVQYFKLFYSLYNVPRVAQRCLSQRQFDTVAFAYADFFVYICRHVRSLFQRAKQVEVWERAYNAGNVELVIACPDWWRQQSARVAMRAAA